jgi:uncharacterized protein
MTFLAPPAVAAWVHQEARTGFEVAGIQPVASGWSLDGCTSAVEDGEAWVVDYAIEVSAHWSSRSARATRRVGAASRSATVECDGHGRWWVDGVPRRDLDGCSDVDLESSALTNAFPVHRLALEPGQSAPAPAAYIRTSLAVERLEQTYTRIDAQEGHQRFRYRAPAFGVECELVYDASGFALRYPGIAVRGL